MTSTDAPLESLPDAEMGHAEEQDGSPRAGPAIGQPVADPPALPSDISDLLAAAPGDPAVSSMAHKLAGLSERAAVYAAKSTGAGTRAAYGSAWRAYSAWCDEICQPALNGDPGLLALYLTKRAEDGLAVSSLRVARSAIRAAHRLAGVPLDLDDARLSLVMEGITRDKGTRPSRRAAPAVPDVLRRLLAALPAPNTPEAAAPALLARNRAILLLAFGGALRRSELAALWIGDVTVVEARGLGVLVRRSKTDQQGRGRELAIWANPRDPEFCPLVAYERWMAVRREAPGGLIAAASPLPCHGSEGRQAWVAGQPLFCGVTSGGTLTGQSMADKILARLMKQACLHAGLDPARFSGHSARRGLLTHAGDLQLPLVDLMRQSRHKSVETALGYIESADLWRNNITEPVFGKG
jgi:integrase